MPQTFKEGRIPPPTLLLGVPPAWPVLPLETYRPLGLSLGVFGIILGLSWAVLMSSCGHDNGDDDNDDDDGIAKTTTKRADCLAHAHTL